jgi:hypothetical protein
MGNDFINRLAYAAAFTKAAFRRASGYYPGGSGYSMMGAGDNYLGGYAPQGFNPYIGGGMGNMSFSQGPSGYHYYGADPRVMEATLPHYSRMLGNQAGMTDEYLKQLGLGTERQRQMLPSDVAAGQIGQTQEALGEQLRQQIQAKDLPGVQHNLTQGAKLQDASQAMPAQQQEDMAAHASYLELKQKQERAEENLRKHQEAFNKLHESEQAKALAETRGEYGKLTGNIGLKQLAIVDALQLGPKGYQHLVDRGFAKDLEDAKHLVDANRDRTGIVDTARSWWYSPGEANKAYEKQVAAQQAYDAHRKAIEGQIASTRGTVDSYRTEATQMRDARQKAFEQRQKELAERAALRDKVVQTATDQQADTSKKLTSENLKQVSPQVAPVAKPLTSGVGGGMSPMPSMPKLPMARPAPKQVTALNKPTLPTIAGTPQMQVAASAPFSVKELAAMAAYVKMRKQAAANKPLGAAPAPAPSGVASAPVVKKPSGGFFSNIGSAVSSAMPKPPVDTSAAKYVQPPPLHTPQDPLRPGRPVLDPLGRPLPTVPAGVGASLQVANNTQGGARPGSLARGSGQTLSTGNVYRNAS